MPPPPSPLMRSIARLVLQPPFDPGYAYTSSSYLAAGGMFVVFYRVAVVVLQKQGNGPPSCRLTSPHRVI